MENRDLEPGDYLGSDITNTLSPTIYADRLGVYYSNTVTSTHKRNLGQFFTPAEIAFFLASFTKITGSKVKILDPGCGTGILSCALLEYVANNFPKVKEIELTAFETDLSVLPFAEKSFSYLREWLASKNINFNHYLCANDFILHNSSLLTSGAKIHEKFHVVIANPPYFKIPKKDPRAEAASSIIYGQTNIYSIFLVVSAKLLEPNGQLIFITPRSFASGNYFRLFREIFFSLVQFVNIHIFISRKDAFVRDHVLQENIIIYARKKTYNQNNRGEKGKIYIDDKVTISTSMGIADINKRNERVFPFSEIVNIDSIQKILHLPITDIDEKVTQVFKSWTDTLDSCGFEISTGPVVDFRSADFISPEKYGSNYVPLIWLNNIKQMEFEWPLTQKPKGKQKGQYIKLCGDSKSRLIKNKNYVFLRRFSSKDDTSRLVASHYFSKWLPKYSHIGVENHLNYIYKKNGVLKRAEVLGIACLLNSKLFDIYFRTFNGNINVSATELRHMPFPPLEQIEVIGNLLDKAKINRSVIDAIIESVFKINIGNDDKKGID